MQTKITQEREKLAHRCLKNICQHFAGASEGVVFGGAIAPTLSAPGVAPTLSALPPAVLHGAP